MLTVESRRGPELKVDDQRTNNPYNSADTVWHWYFTVKI